MVAQEEDTTPGDEFIPKERLLISKNPYLFGPSPWTRIKMGWGRVRSSLFFRCGQVMWNGKVICPLCQEQEKEAGTRLLCTER